MFIGFRELKLKKGLSMKIDSTFFDIKTLNFRRFATAAFAFVSIVLSGCAPGIPLLKQLESEKLSRIAIIVESPPFEYTVPVPGDFPFVGSALPVFLGPFGALAVENNLNRDHVMLTQAAVSTGLKTDHRKEFLAQVIKGLSEKGFAVEVIQTKFQPASLGKIRYFFKPDLTEVKLPADIPSLYLNLDIGSCTVGTITPCVRYQINSTGVLTAPQPNQKYRGAAGFEPNFFRISPKNSFHFETIDIAIGRIAEFDQALAKLIPTAAKRMIDGLEKGPERRTN
jgi:hypothetical protein